jgi:hypothetical protein
MASNSRLFSVTYFLLRAATLLSILALGILLLCLIGVSAILVANLGDALGIPVLLDEAPRNQVLTLAAVAMAGGFVYVLLALLVFVLFTKIVETAMTGDPFVSENADRLKKAGWLLLGIYGVGMVTGIAALSLVPPELIEMAGKEGSHIQITGLDEPSPVGILTVLLIFVLAQIFRRGAEMRAELEGTV